VLEDLLDKAKNSFQAKNYSAAIHSLSYLLNDPEYKVRALANIGACLYHLNHHRAAKKYLSKALAIEPDFGAAQFSLANTQFALGNYQDAAVLYSLVIKNDPNNDSAWHGKFDCLLMKDQLEDCQIHLTQWISQLPTSKKVSLAQGLLLRQKGNREEAIRSLKKALVHEPASARVYALISELLVDLRSLEDGLAYINKAIELDRTEVNYICIKANIHYLLSQVTKSSQAYAEAVAICPSSATLILNQFLLFPIIPLSTDEISLCRTRFLEGLSLTENSSAVELLLHHPMAAHTFPLAYHNQNDRVLLERYTKLMKKLAEPLLQQLADSYQPASPPTHNHASSKIRIGFLSRYFCSHSNTLAFEGLIRNLDRSKFQVILIHAPDSKSDPAQERLNHCCNEVIYLTKSFTDMFRTLREASLDILFFTDLGMNPFDFLFPLLRTCRIQLTGWGIPHTSGNNCIDYYISAEGIEPTDAHSHYTEKLIMLPGGLPCCFLADRQSVPSIPRSYFFLPTHCHLVGCLQSLHKLHPDFDLIMEEVARHNPEAIFVFVEDSNSRSTELFLQRLSQNAPSVREQCFFLQIMTRSEYQALCGCMDILLDPIYYGSGITFFEASLVGTPIVTLEGSYLRSRVVSSGYREMGLSDAPIAHSGAEYVTIATDLLRDDQKRQTLKNRILNQNERIFNRMDYVKNFEDFCISIV
jgi:predicted O-linked N-acetylglucosamine transferase (SPINDLY family)